VFEFFLLMMILLGTAWGAAMLYFVARALSKRLDAPEPGPADALLREDVESLSHRLSRVEEELEFYKRLKAPDDDA
jgi:hypothetical protein